MDGQDVRRGGSVITFVDMGVDGGPAPSPTSGNDFLLTTLRVVVRCPSGARFWLDTRDYEHRGLPVHCPAGVLRVSSARTTHQGILDAACLRHGWRLCNRCCSGALERTSAAPRRHCVHPRRRMRQCSMLRLSWSSYAYRYDDASRSL